MSQLSFFSAESVPPEVADLTGVLAASGQVVTVGAGARLSVVVDSMWRAVALAEMMTAGGLQAEITDVVGMDEDDAAVAMHAAVAVVHAVDGGVVLVVRTGGAQVEVCQLWR